MNWVRNFNNKTYLLSIFSSFEIFYWLRIFYWFSILYWLKIFYWLRIFYSEYCPDSEYSTRNKIFFVQKKKRRLISFFCRKKTWREDKKNWIGETKGFVPNNKTRELLPKKKKKYCEWIEYLEWVGYSEWVEYSEFAEYSESVEYSEWEEYSE